MAPRINLTTRSASEVSAHEEDYNSSFHDASQAPHLFPTPPSELPTRFATHLPLILDSQRLLPSAVQTIYLTASQSRLILKASTASLHTRVLNRVYLDDLEDEISPSFSSLVFPAQGLFLRLDACSPKDGERGLEPLRSVHDIYLRLTTSYRACSSIQRALDRNGDEKSSLELFFLPFNANMDTSLEYRVFCAPDSSSRFSAASSSLKSSIHPLVADTSAPAAASIHLNLPPPPQISAISQYRWREPSSLSPLLPTSSTAFRKTVELITSEALRIHGLIVAAAVERSQALTRGASQSGKGESNSSPLLSSNLGEIVNPDQLLFEQGFVFDIRFVQEDAQALEDRFSENAKGESGDADEQVEVKGRCELIELNTFGTMSACGAALFHWIRDEKALYGLNGGSGQGGQVGEEREIEFRISI